MFYIAQILPYILAFLKLSSSNYIKTALGNIDIDDILKKIMLSNRFNEFTDKIADKAVEKFQFFQNDSSTNLLNKKIQHAAEYTVSNSEKSATEPLSTSTKKYLEEKVLRASAGQENSEILNKKSFSTSNYVSLNINHFTNKLPNIEHNGSNTEFKKKQKNVLSEIEQREYTIQEQRKTSIEYKKHSEGEIKSQADLNKKYSTSLESEKRDVDITNENISKENELAPKDNSENVTESAEPDLIKEDYDTDQNQQNEPEDSHEKDAEASVETIKTTLTSFDVEKNRRQLKNQKYSRGTHERNEKSTFGKRYTTPFTGKHVNPIQRRKSLYNYDRSSEFDE